MAGKTNGQAAAGAGAGGGKTDQDNKAAGSSKTALQPKEMLAIRDKFLARFAQVTLALMGVPRYASNPLSDLQRLVLEPLVRDRVAVATLKGDDAAGQAGTMAGVAIWASVSDEVDTKIREQIKAGVFPVRLTGDDWRSGDKIWLLDLIAPNQKLAAAVLSNFGQVTKGGGQASLHPIITKMIDAEVLEKMGAKRE